MKKWKRVCNFANGTVYALGKHRKLEIPDHPDIFFETVTKEIRWSPGTVNGKPIRQQKAAGYE